MREDRFLLGASPDVPDVWSHAVLRQLANSARQQTRARQRTLSEMKKDSSKLVATSWPHQRGATTNAALLHSKRVCPEFLPPVMSALDQ